MSNKRFLPFASAGFLALLCLALSLETACSQKPDPAKQTAALPHRPAASNSPGPLAPPAGSDDIILCHWDDPATAARLHARLAHFLISEGDAYKIAEEAYYDRGEARLFIESLRQAHFILIGNRYLFGKPYKGRIVLKGYLVDGSTGEVHWVEIAQ